MYKRGKRQGTDVFRECTPDGSVSGSAAAQPPLAMPPRGGRDTPHHLPIARNRQLAAGREQGEVGSELRGAVRSMLVHKAQCSSLPTAAATCSSRSMPN